jgi:Gram-negative porin
MKKTLLSLAAALAVTPAIAATSFGDHVSLSGFGTVGVVSSDNKQDAFVRDGAPSGAGGKASWKVDSKIAVQADVTATSWLSGTVQVLAEQRYEPSVTAGFEWAFVKLKPMDGLSIRLGRIAPAMFMVSDSRNVGFANTAVRMPNEVYSLAGLKRLKGGDVSYRFGLGGTTLTVAALVGESEFENANVSLKSEDTHGLNLLWETSYGSFRIGEVRTKNVVANFIAPGVTVRDPYTFTGVGYAFDNSDWMVNAEYVQRRSELAGRFVNSDGWYVLGGYRFGNFMPYAFVAETKEPKDAVSTLNGKQSTLAVGLRWDVVSGAALKLQFEAVDPKGTMGVSHTPGARDPVTFATPVRDKSNVVSVAVDFVF